MEKKYINKSRYKSSSSELKKNRRKENISKKIRNANNVVKKKEISHKVITKNTYKKKRKSKINLLLLAVLSVLLILILIRFMTKEPDEAFFDIFKTKVEEDIIEKLDIGIVDNVDILDINTKNVILTELNGYISGNLLTIDDEYNIKFDLLESVEKVSNTEYILKISSNNSLTTDILKSKINSYKSSDSKYYLKVKNIDAMESINSKTLKVNLINEDALFVYDLQMPINYTSLDSGLYYQNTVKDNDNMLSYMVKENINLTVPAIININKIESDEIAVRLFKSKNINMFVTNTYSIDEVLGNEEFNFSSYRNGECLFLFGNKNSELFSKKEVRQAIAYSIDREKIVKEVYLNSGELIDIPFIYSNVQYKYDIYGAQNILLSKGYTLKDNLYTLNGKKLELTLLVNKQDETKLKVATLIKEDLQNVGIKINIKKLSESEIIKNISKGTYDLVLADLNINEKPDISYFYEHININDKVREAVSAIQNETNISNLEQHIQKLQYTLSDEIACIGVHASTTYLVYSKSINVFDNISYMNVFTKLLN